MTLLAAEFGTGWIVLIVFVVLFVAAAVTYATNYRKVGPNEVLIVAGGTKQKVTEDDGTSVRVICGELWGTRGAVDGIAASPHYFDIAVPSGTTRSIRIDVERNAFAYIFAGDGRFADASEPRGVKTEPVGYPGRGSAGHAADRTLVLFDRGDEVRVTAGEHGIRFLLVSGEPLDEPVAWYGPIVMNTQAELRTAFEEYEKGTFLKHKGVFG